MNVEQYLEKKGFTYETVRRPSGINAIMNCPFCGDTEQKFAINLSSGAYRCLHENRCGRHGSFRQFQEALGDKPVIDSKFAVKPSGKKYKRPRSRAKTPGKKALEWFHGRGITKETVSNFRIGTDGNDTIMFPYFRDDILINIKYRDINAKKFWMESGAEPALFNMDNIPGDELIITEGEVDAMTFVQWGYSAVSVPAGVNNQEWIETCWEWLDRFTLIYLCFDRDEAGQQAARTVAQRLGRSRCVEIALPQKDANECLCAGMDAKEIGEYIINARTFTRVEILPPNAFSESILKIMNQDEELYGIKTGFSGLDNILKGWRGGELTVWTGRNSSGKTTLLNEVGIRILEQHNKRVCYFSLEMNPVRLIRWMALRYIEDNTEKSLHKALEKLNGILVADYYREIDERQLFELVEYAARRYNVKHFVIDSLMRVDFGDIGGEYLQYQKRFVNRLIDLAQTYNAHIHLVAHPRKGQSDSMAPDKVDVSGSGDITNLAHNVIAVWRPGDRDKEIKSITGEKVNNMMIVKKNREYGIEGMIPLLFNSERKIFSDTEMEK